jgi:hypothetical protein
MAAVPVLLCCDGRSRRGHAIAAAGELLGGGQALVLYVGEPFRPSLVAPVIVDASETRAARAVVMGNRGEGAAESALNGSVSSGVRRTRPSLSSAHANGRGELRTAMPQIGRMRGATRGATFAG